LKLGRDSAASWPAYLLDLIPAGVARDNWLKRLNLVDGFDADFELLAKGAINPPGHIRVKTEKNPFEGNMHHAGFDYSEVVGRGVDFIDYAESMGAIVSGTSGAQGVAPKFLLVQDSKEKWHGDGAISDSQIKESWLVKFPRGKKESDYKILELEAAYYRIAKKMGVRVHGPLLWDQDALFVPRFDREIQPQKGLVRKGLESLISAMGVADFGVSKSHEDYIQIIAKYCTRPKIEIQEYILRDFLNIVMGNTDNHGRNTALLKELDGTIKLSPLFDFAPMTLDDSGIARVSKWQKEDSQIPNFSSIYDLLLAHKFTADEASVFLKKTFEQLENLMSEMKREKIEGKTLERVTRKFDEFMKKYLEELKQI
ncbi:MAG: type II toxin-antitoxin system HipA family toxin, partial [Pseudobdellovibrionaceae bacterium]